MFKQIISLRDGNSNPKKELDLFTDELKNNEIVEIITSKNAKPNRKWLEHVKTSFAKKNIRNFI